MKSGLSIAVLALASVVSITPSLAAAQASGTSEEWTAEDRAVVAALLDRNMGDRPLIVVADSTFVWGAEANWGTYIRKWVHVDAAPLQEALDDYSARNQHSYAVPADLPTRRPVRIYPQREFRQRSSFDQFKQLQAVVPGATSYHWVSRPGYDGAHTIAAFYTVMNCEGLCGTGSVVVLRRTSEGWLVLGVAVMVIS